MSDLLNLDSNYADESHQCFNYHLNKYIQNISDERFCEPVDDDYLSYKLKMLVENTAINNSFLSENAQMLRTLNLNKEEMGAIRYLSFLTLKPTMYIANVHEDGFENNP